jgi:hypothetical protein
MEKTAKCGCFISGAIQMCPTHAAAPELLETLEELLRIFNDLCEQSPTIHLEWEDFVNDAQLLVNKVRGTR